MIFQNISDAIMKRLLNVWFGMCVLMTVKLASSWAKKKYDVTDVLEKLRDR